LGVTRLAIPLAAILLGLAAFSARPGGERVRPAAGPAAPPAAAPAAEVPAPPAGEATVPPMIESAGRTTAAQPGLDTPIPAVPDPHVGNRPIMVALLERELSLSPDQKRRVDEIFHRRSGEIGAHHRELRAAGAISGSAYHRRMQDLRALSYAQVGQVLDSGQHRRFLEIVGSGRLNDVIGFPIDDAMVQVD